MKKCSLLFIVFFLVSFQPNGPDVPNLRDDMQLSDADKQFLLDYYKKTEEHLKAITGDMSEAQLQYKATEDRWSVSQVLEHIILTERSIFGMATELMTHSPAPERRGEIMSTDEDLIRGMEDRNEKYQAPEDLQPSGKYISTETALKEFDAQREEILAFINKYTEEEMRNQISDSPFGAIDAYQSLIFIAGHTARHTKQIEEVMAEPSFPKK